MLTHCRDQAITVVPSAMSTASKRRNTDMMKLMMSNFDVKLTDDGDCANDFCVSPGSVDIQTLILC
jgi:hypothetical protein